MVDVNTVVSPINGHSNQRTPPISGQFSLHRQNLGQTLIENFLKSGQGISGHSNQRTLFSARKCIFYFFLPPFSGHPKNFSDQSRDNNKKTRLSYVYIYFKHLKRFYIKLIFHCFQFFSQPHDYLFLTVKLIDYRDLLYLIGKKLQ